MSPFQSRGPPPPRADESTKGMMAYPHPGPLGRCPHGKIPTLCQNSIFCFCQIQSTRVVISFSPFTMPWSQTIRLLLRSRSGVKLSSSSLAVWQCECVTLFVLRVYFLSPPTPFSFSLYYWLSHSVATSLSLFSQFASASDSLRGFAQHASQTEFLLLLCAFVPVSQTVFVLWVEGRAAVVTPPTASRPTPPPLLSVLIVKVGINQNNISLWGNSSRFYLKSLKLAGLRFVCLGILWTDTDALR